MQEKKKILAISGSTRNGSTNHKILKLIAELVSDNFELTLFDGLATLPHFNPDLDNVDSLPKEVEAFRSQVSEPDGIIICTPEYIFSLPGSLKNAFEWCVSTTIFSDKKVALITASASGQKGHEELNLIMKTLGAVFNDETSILISGVRGKIDVDGKIIHEETLEKVTNLVKKLLEDLAVGGS
ncbi:NAD(P)H dehydrogenase (quinone) [Emticicia aquatilis]|uniref:NAD(P)H dehydrogenase (Quinone) n=1 Tax=Emticicia aquatilis TaxID=1537369 RepID=A0A916Z8K4_9BACT|nr:NAD(P)H-dependent oxidoreductase [Emticicia aquatilis]GGD80658.1 NAD(P)H dehydrogenase (quinone) [Emticicia aquatilis]